MKAPQRIRIKDSLPIPNRSYYREAEDLTLSPPSVAILSSAAISLLPELESDSATIFNGSCNWTAFGSALPPDRVQPNKISQKGTERDDGEEEERGLKELR